MFHAQRTDPLTHTRHSRESALQEFVQRNGSPRFGVRRFIFATRSIALHAAAAAPPSEVGVAIVNPHPQFSACDTYKVSSSAAILTGIK